MTVHQQFEIHAHISRQSSADTLGHQEGTRTEKPETLKVLSPVFS